MKRKTWIYSALLGLALVLALAWAFAPRPVEVELATAAVAPFESTIDEDGKTRVADRYVISAPLAGRLERITLREGDAVVEGGVVARLTPVLSPLLDARTRSELGARVEMAEAQIGLAGARIARAQVGLEQARIDARRSEQLAQQGFIAPTKLDTDRLAVQAAQKELDAAVQQRRIAGHELQQAHAALAAVQPGAGARSAGFAVRAPVAGQVLRVLQASEDTVALGTPLLEIGDVARMEIVAELLTTDALAATPGRHVVIERWGGPGNLEGRVRRVEPAAFTKVSALGVEEQRVKVLIEIESPRDRWRALGDGFRVGVRIVTLAEDKALQVPASAVFPLPAGQSESTPDGARHMAVFVVDGGRARIVPVTLRARNAGMAWLASGLTAGAKVIVYPPATVADGVRVKERKV